MGLDALQRRLTDINQTLAKSSRLTTTAALAEDIASDVADLEPENYALAIALLFDAEQGILRFFRLARGSKEHNDAKAILLKVLGEIMYIMPTFVKEYVTDIQAICRSLFDSVKESSKVKENSFLPLVAILDPALQLLDPAKIDVQRIFGFYFDAYIKQNTKLTASVKSSILKLLGKISRYYPDSIDDKQALSLELRLMQAIQSLFDAKADLPHIEGGVQGLNDYLFRNDIRLDLNKVFHAVSFMIEGLKIESIARYAIPAAGLQMIIDHADKFRANLYAQYETTYHNLRAATQKGNQDISKLGYRAMDQFLKQVAGALKEEAEPDEQCFSFFMDKFIKMINQDKASYKDISLAIRAFGFFAAPCKLLVGEKRLRDLAQQIVKKNALLVSGLGDRDEFSVHLPSFLDAYAYIANELSSIDLELSSALENIAKTLLTSFPSMSSAYQGLSVAAFRNLVRMLNKRGTVGKSFWSKIAYEALVVTCTAASTDELVGEELTGARRFVFEDYMAFWEQLFYRRLGETDDAEEREQVNAMLYDETIKAMIQLPQNLNLSLVNTNEESVGSPSTADATGSISAVNPVDISILNTLAKFADRLLLRSDRTLRNRFVQWMYPVADKWVELSLQNPLLSGFYNLTNVIVKLVDDTGFLKGAVRVELMGIAEGTEDDFTETATSTQKSMYLLFTRYIKQVLVQSQTFKDDLLASCLRLVLACPVQLVSLQELIAPMCAAFKLGLSYPPLARVALDSLERCVKNFPATVLKRSYKTILPVLADYLTLDVESNQSAAVDIKSNLHKSINTPFQMRGLTAASRRVLAMATMDESINVQLKDVRDRIISLLGNLGGDNRLMLEGAASAEQTTAWDMEKRVWFDMPFKEINCRIYLDDLLPRMIDLSENSPDRKTKVAATELLHACVLVMIGRSAKQLTNVGSGETKKSPFHKLYQKVFPALLRLAIDLDKVTRELFRPLVFQIIHWLTKNSKAENPETMAMLNTCLDAISGTNGPLRDFASECVAEFLKWSIKHTSPRDQEKNPMNAKSLLKRMYRLLLHSNSYKRLGAAITFNKIYRILREEDALVDQFTFEILYHLLMGLRLADSDNPAFGTQQETRNAIEHVMKIIKKKVDVFRHASAKRRTFPGLTKADLAMLMEWLFSEIGRNELVYSQQCMILFNEVAHLISDPKDWLRRQIDNSRNFLVDILERNLAVPRGAELQSRRGKAWLSQLTTALNGYTFLIDAKILDASSILTLPASNLIPSSVYFTEACAIGMHDLDMDPTDRLKLNERRSFTVVKMLNFLLSVLEQDAARNISTLGDMGMWNPRFFQLVARCVFRPSEIGFALESEEVKQSLPKLVEGLLRRLAGPHMPEKYRGLLVDSLAELYFTGEVDIAIVDLKDMQKHSFSLQTIGGLRQLQHAGLLHSVMDRRMSDSTADVVDILVTLRNETDPLMVSLVGNLVELCLCDSTKRDRCLSELLGLNDNNNSEQASSFYQRYRNNIDSQLATHFRDCTSLFRKYLYNPVIKQILPSIPQYLLQNKTSRPDLCRRFFDQLVESASFLQDVSRVLGPEALMELWKILVQLDPKVLEHRRGTAFSKIFSEVFMTFLNPQSPLAKVNEALAMLPVFLTEPANASEIETRLDNIAVNCFPISSKELEEGTSRSTDYIDAMHELLRALETSDGVVIPKVLVRHVCRESEHRFAEPLSRSIKRAVKRLAMSDLEGLANILFGYFRDNSLPMEIRRNVITYMLVPAFTAASKALVRNFFAREVTHIMSRLTEPVDNKQNSVKDQLLEKAACYELMEICYCRLDVQDVHSANGAVLKAYSDGTPKTGKELSQSLIKLANAAKNESVGDDSPDVTRLKLGYHQAAYNALAAAIASTQKDALVKFCAAFLFKENRQKNEDHWRNIVDVNETVQTRFLERSLLRSRGSVNNTENAYLAAQYFTESSLSQTVTLSLGHQSTILRDRAAYTSVASSQNDEGLGALNGDTEIGEQSTIFFEQPSRELLFDHNPCMRRLVAIVQRLDIAGKGSESDATMPSWMHELYLKISDSETPINIRLFVAALVMNVSEVFAPYTSEWWKAFADLIALHNQYSDGISGFVEDLCTQLLIWGGHVKQELSVTQALRPEDTQNSRELVFRMIESLAVSASKPDSLPVIKRNLSLVSSFAEIWSHIIVSPTKTIYEHITSDGKDEKPMKRKLAGLYLTSTLIGNDINPFDARGLGAMSLSEHEFCNAFLKLMLHERKQVYSFAAEVLGHWLTATKKRNSYSGVVLEQGLRMQLTASNGLRGSLKEEERYVQILNRLSVGIPEIVKDYARDLLFLLPKFAGKMRAKCLYALSSCAPSVENIFDELRAKNLLNLLQHREDDTQINLLIILFNVAPTLRTDQISFFLPTALNTFPHHPSDRCRSAFYTLIMRLYEITDEKSELRKTIKLTILKGLSDPNEEVRSALVNYLKQNDLIQSDVFERAQLLLGLYEPEVETSYLNFSTFLFMDAAKEGPQYVAKLFDSGLPDATFVDASIDTSVSSWAASGSMQPLFAATQATLRGTQEVGGFVRATQEPQWTLTQTTGIGPTQARDIFSLSQSDVTSAFTSFEGSRSQREIRSGEYIRRAHQQDARRFFANRAERQRRTQIRTQQVQKAERTRAVTLARKYRSGDLPDIEIAYKEIIDPLQALAMRDFEISHRVLSSLLISIYGQVDEYQGIMGGQERDTYKRMLVDHLDRILGSSKVLYPPVIAMALRTLYDIATTSGFRTASPEIIGRASEGSANSELGILLLEKLIDEPSQEPASKRSRIAKSATNRQNADLWAQLARLYKSVNKLDLYRTIYECHISSTLSVKEAITAESLGQFDRALAKYKAISDADSADIEPHELELAHQGLAECLSHMGLYDQLALYVMMDIDQKTEKLWEQEYQDTFLPLFVRAFLRLRHEYQNENGIRVDWTEEHPNPLFPFILAALDSPERRDLLQSHLPKGIAHILLALQNFRSINRFASLIELAMTLLAQNDLNRARYYVRRAQDEFTRTFGALHPLAHEARLSKLSQLQLLVEMQTFLDIDASNASTRSAALDLIINQWQTKFPSQTDSIDIWDDLITLRLFISEKCESFALKDDQRQALKAALVHSKRQLAKTATRQHNFEMAKRHLVVTDAAFDPVAMYAALKLKYNELKQAENEHKASSAGIAMSNFAYFKDNIASLDNSTRAKFLHLEGRLYDQLLECMLDDDSLSKMLLDNKHVRKSCAKLRQGVTPADADSLLECFLQHASRCLHESITLNPDEKRRLRLAIHCDKVLRRAEDLREESWASRIDVIDYAKTVIHNVLAAMHSGNKQAIEMYARLLQLVESYEQCCDDFQRLAASLPSWTFLRWLPQMTAVLDKPSGRAVFSVIERIAHDYPSALFFPLSISSEQYVFNQDQNALAAKKKVEELKETLKSPLMEKFKFELKRLTEPAHIFKDWLERTDALIRSEGPDKLSAIMAAFEEMKAYCLEDHDMGEVGKAFASKHSANLIKMCGKDGAKLGRMTPKQWKESVQRYYGTHISGKEALPHGMVALKKYSPWLAAFNARNFEEHIEIPGQYDGMEKPRPEHHITIASFHSEVLVMSSMRRPKRLKIVGSDEKEHPWLIKGGEDLRLDQRIQQLFSVMNDIMSQDTYCASQGLALRTYKVIPMSTTLGILEWVDNTMPLRQVMESISGFREESTRADQQHMAFVDRHRGAAKTIGDIYGNMFRKADRNATISHMHSIVLHQPYLRAWMHKLAASPEAFLSIRAEFAKSLATLSICSYLLGIGDRHAENFLIDMGTGKIVGIDFGHAFGSATEVLPIPELVPFRLTRQMELALEPLGIRVLLEYPMINVLRAMRERKHVLLNAMNIFIKEPLMEWRKFALSQAQKQGRTSQATSDSTESSLNPPAWYPQQKLDIARQERSLRPKLKASMVNYSLPYYRRKLEGENPAYLTAQELKWGHGDKPWLRAVQDVLFGEKGQNRRADVGQKCGSVKEQVECLIDQATDPNILGRTWRGWGAWS